MWKIERRLLLCVCFIVLTIPINVFAAQVPQEVIRQVAENFLKYQVGNFGSWAGVDNPAIDRIDLVEHDAMPIAYNVSVKPSGYLLIPYYDEFSPVVVFSYTSSFSPARVSERNSVESWILPEMTTIYRNIQSKRGVLDATESLVYADTPVGKAWKFYTQADRKNLVADSGYKYATVGPLLPTQWDQGGNTSPYTYNLYTPAGTGGTVGTCGHTLTGCVATAWSQVLRYWKWPAQGVGSHSYSWNNTTLSRDFTQSVYDWNNMPAQLTSSSTTAQIQAVARLIADVGIAVDMNYGCSDSGSNMYADNPAILPAYFNYKNSAVQRPRTSYTATTWFSLFQTEFDAAPPRPIVLSIFSSAGGHEIVADGYQTGASNYVHVNMGWSGSYDAYYDVYNNFTTGSYTWLGQNHVIVTGIQPNGSVTPTTYTLSASKSGSGSGTVTSSPSGISCGVTCSASYASGTSVTLTASPASGSTFGGWSGACSGTGTCTLTMNSAQSVTATFTSASSSTSNIIQNPGFESGTSNWLQYSSGGYANITNDPGYGNNGSNYYALLGGYNNAVDYVYQDVTIPSSATSVTLDYYYYIGTNETTSSSAYDQMVVLVYDPPTSTSPTTITAMSNLNKTSNTWKHSSSFDLSAYKGKTISLLFAAVTDATNSSFFAIDDIKLNVTTAAAVNGSCGSANGTSVTVAPTTNLCSNGTPSSVSGTGPWSWSCSGSGGGTTANCSANVLTPSYTLSVLKSGAGSGTVTSSPAGISCGSTCSASYNSGTSVTLTASPASGSTFAGWSGACSGSGTCTVSMTSAQSVTATFTQQTSSSITTTYAGTYYLSAIGGGNMFDMKALSSNVSITGFDLNIYSTAGVVVPVKVYYKSGTYVGSEMSQSSWTLLNTYSVTSAGSGNPSKIVNVSGLTIPAGQTYGIFITPSDGTTTLLFSSGAGSYANSDVSLTLGIATAYNFSAYTTSGQYSWNGSIYYTTGSTPPSTYALSVLKSGSGSGTVTSSPAGISCGATCSYSYTSGTSVTLTAAPASGSSFGGWSGACSGTGTCTVTMSAAKSVTATFTLASTTTPSINYYHQSDGTVAGLTTNGSTVTGGTQFYQEANAAWSIVGQGDFDGDGIRDLVWWNNRTGQVYIMLMSSPTAVKSGAVAYTEPNTYWRIVATGDLNGDSKTDLIWWNQLTGQVVAMLMNGTAVIGSAVIYTEPNTDWKIVAAADFNGNGKAELLWWNSSTGQAAIGQTNGTSASTASVIYTESNTSWRIAGAGDLDGDGKADIVWHNRKTGQVFGIQTNGSSVTNGAMLLTEPNTYWEIVSVGNYNSDSKAELLWWNQQTGQVYLMPMNGLSVAPGGALLYTEPDLTWKIQGETEWRDNLYGRGMTTTTK